MKKTPKARTSGPASCADRHDASKLVLSIFPGIGLLDRAFEEEGWCVVRGHDPLWGGDVRNFFPPAGVFAGVIGGPPCQTFSPLANLVRANGHEVRFGNLIPEFERCVSATEPAWFMMENVRGAPTPVCDGYAVSEFFLDNAFVAGEGDARLADLMELEVEIGEEPRIGGIGDRGQGLGGGGHDGASATKVKTRGERRGNAEAGSGPARAKICDTDGAPKKEPRRAAGVLGRGRR